MMSLAAPRFGDVLAYNDGFEAVSKRKDGETNMEIYKAPKTRTPTEEMTDEEAFAKDYTRKCMVCDMTPVVNVTGLCGPCTFGEAETISGNW